MQWLAIGSGVALAASIGLLSMFFVTRNERFDRLAEWAFVLLAMLAIPTILQVGGRMSGGIATTILTVVGVAGVGAVGVGELSINRGLVDFRRISAVVAIGFAGFLAWVGGTSVMSLASGGLPVAQAWLGAGSIGVALVLMAVLLRTPGVATGQREPSPIMMAGFFAPILGVVAWLIWLGTFVA